MRPSSFYHIIIISFIIPGCKTPPFAFLSLVLIKENIRSVFGDDTIYLSFKINK